MKFKGMQVDLNRVTYVYQNVAQVDKESCLSLFEHICQSAVISYVKLALL